jgi:hypothetical protein
MIRDLLIPQIQERFIQYGPVINMTDNPVVTFTNSLPAIGELTIWDDGEEATLAIGKISHGHFSVYENGLSPEVIHQRIADNLLDFLEALFADKVLMWISDDEVSGGWQRIDLSPDISPPEPGGRFYFWSGPTEFKV